MHRTAKSLIALVVVLALVLTGVASAFAAYSLVVTTKPSVVTYPHMSRVFVGLDGFASSPATVTVQYRRVDGGTWTDWSGRRITAKRSDDATSFSFTATPPWLNQTTEFRAIVSGVATSAVATVTVKARVSQPQVVFSQPRKKTPRAVQFRGLIWPVHTKGTDVVTLKFSKLVNRTWVEQPSMTLTAKISKWKYWLPWTGRQSDYASKWQVTVPMSAFGSTNPRTRWAVQASHADTAHAASESAKQWFWIR